MPLLLVLYYFSYCSFDIWNNVSLAATKFESFMSSVLGFTVPYAANILIIMVSYDFRLFPAWFRYEIIDMRNLERLMHVTGRCAPR
jgi:hypothetical protein